MDYRDCGAAYIVWSGVQCSLGSYHPHRQSCNKPPHCGLHFVEQQHLLPPPPLICECDFIGSSYVCCTPTCTRPCVRIRADAPSEDNNVMGNGSVGAGVEDILWWWWLQQKCPCLQQMIVIIIRLCCKDPTRRSSLSVCPSVPGDLKCEEQHRIVAKWCQRITDSVKEIIIIILKFRPFSSVEC